MAKDWKTTPCAKCKRTVKTRTVSMLRGFRRLCGPCARRAEAQPFTERV